MLFADGSTSDLVQIVVAICGVVTALGVPLIAVLGGYIAYRMNLIKQGQEKATEAAKAAADKADEAAAVAASAAEGAKSRDEAAAIEVKKVKDRQDQQFSMSVRSDNHKSEKMDDLKKTILDTQAAQSEVLAKVEKGINGDGLGGKLDQLTAKVEQHGEIFAQHIADDAKEFEATRDLIAAKTDHIAETIAAKTIIKPPTDHTTDQAYTPGDPFKGA